MGWLSDAYNAVTSKASSAYNSVESSVASYFSGTPLKVTIPAPSTGSAFSGIASYFPSALSKIESVGSSAAGSVESFFSGLETKAAAAGDAVTTRLKSYATGAAELGGNVVGSAVKGVVGGMGLPTMIVVMIVALGLAWIYVRRP